MKWLINKIFETVKRFFQWFGSTEKTRADQEMEEARRAAVNTILTPTYNLEDRATLIQSLFRGYKVRSADACDKPSNTIELG